MKVASRSAICNNDRYFKTSSYETCTA